MGPSIKPYYKNRNWKERKKYHRTLKASTTKADTNSEEADDSNTVFSDSIFTVADASDQVQSHSTSDKLAIPEDKTIKGIFDAASDQMQVLETITTSDSDTVTLVIHKSQVEMLAKRRLLSLIKAETHIQ